MPSPKEPILKPCPNCGGVADIRYTKGSGPNGATSNVYYRSRPAFVKCRKCGLQTARATKACRAVDRWNARADEELTIHLPCKEGTTVYEIDGYYCTVCDRFHYRILEKPFHISMYPDVGKTIFLSYANALAEVEKLKAKKTT